MKLLDNIINKFGNDKVLHFVVGGWLTALFALFGIIPMVIGVVVTALISFIKEKYLDTEFDKNDIFAALIGSGISVVVFLISLLF